MKQLPYMLDKDVHQAMKEKSAKTGVTMRKLGNGILRRALGLKSVAATMLCIGMAFGLLMAADAPTAQKQASLDRFAPPPPADVALAASKAYTKALAAWADLQSLNRQQSDEQRVYADAQKVLRDIQDSARVAQNIPAECFLSQDIAWVKMVGGAAQPCLLPAPVPPATPEAKENP